MITHPPVKINLGLNILSKREDGYHNIETVFVKSHQFSDTLEIILGDDYSRTSARLSALYGECSQIVSTDKDGAANNEDDDFVPTLAQGISRDGKVMITVARKEGVDWNVLNDLCVKAYKILDNDFNLPPVKIWLEKTSPVGAGLGGGSADAAYTLKMLNEIAGLGLSQEALADYAARLGSDCAFFIYDYPMLGEGRGEKLSPIELPFELHDGLYDDPKKKPDNDEILEDKTEKRDSCYELVIVAPEGVQVSTAEAYRGVVPSVPEIRIKEILSLPLEKWKSLLINDFEKTVFTAHPELEAIKQSLYDSGAIYASMSGSGSALFGIFTKFVAQSE